MNSQMFCAKASLCFSVFGLAHAASCAPRSVPNLTLENYLGRWHEITRIPNRFQDNEPRQFGPCKNTTAEYSLRPPTGEIMVRNTCTRFKPSGESTEEVALGVAHVVGDSGNARLKVNFTGFALLRWFGIGDGDYWVLGLGPINAEGLYGWALVGSPKLDYGWVLSRTPALAESDLGEILDLAEKQGYSRSSFVRIAP